MQNHNEDSSIHKHNCSMPKPLGLVATMTSSMLSFQLGRAVIARSGRHLAIWVACGTATRQHSPEPYIANMVEVVEVDNLLAASKSRSCARSEHSPCLSVEWKLTITPIKNQIKRICMAMFQRLYSLPGMSDNENLDESLNKHWRNLGGTTPGMAGCSSKPTDKQWSNLDLHC